MLSGEFSIRRNFQESTLYPQSLTAPTRSSPLTAMLEPRHGNLPQPRHR
jgi:hypothetical protein